MRALICATSAGAAIPLEAVCHRLEDSNIEVAMYVVGDASRAIAGSRFSQPSLDSETDLLIVSEELLSSYRPSVVVTGTSLGWSLDKALTGAARRSGVPTVALLDSWMNVERRFQDDSGEVDSGTLPETLIVMDEATSAELTEKGMPCSRILALGHPSFDPWHDLGSSIRGGQANVRVGSDLLSLLFASQALRGSTAGNALPYDQREAIVIVARLTEALEAEGYVCTLRIKPHPAEDVHELQAFIDTLDIEAMQLTNDTPIDSVSEADLVFGMCSTLLVEAYIAGKPVISIQPALSRESDEFILTRMGLVGLAQDFREAHALTMQALRGVSTPTLLRGWEPGATNRIVTELRKIMERGHGLL